MSPDPLERKIHTTPIAIIGMASIFPQARTLPEYWENILNKIDAIVDVPASRWSIEDYYDPNPAAPDKTYCKRGAFMPDVEFDPAEFGLPPNLLEVTDVSQLLSLVVAKECLEDAGYGEGRETSRENTGVILGMVGIGSKLVTPLMARLQYPVWEKVLRSYGISAEDTQKIIDKIKLAYPNWEENAFPGSIGNVVAGRIANRFDLGGTNCVVDAACASSLAAIHMAIAELIEGRADMMITGGVDTDNSIGAYLCFSKTPAFSKGQNVRTFDKDSDGMMVGEGIGMLLLKRLADAQRDGDRVYAVIKGVGTSSDGRFKSIYAPRPAGQAKALRRAYVEAGYSPATVGLIEAHGTGTMAGDPAEFQGLNEVFSEGNPNKQYIALGSVKSQIAHTKAAAGAASMIKVALALYHKVLPATINVKTPNPKLEIEKSPFYLNTEIRPWFKPAGQPRRAGVSSFGFGGTNYHVALEENESEHSGAYRLESVPQVVVLSAATPEELLAQCQVWSGKLAGTNSKQEFAALVLSTKARAVLQNEARVGFVAATPQEGLAQLNLASELVKSKGSQENAEHPAGVYYRKSGIDPKGKLVALFPGQGSQYVDMGRELAIHFPPVREAFAEMDKLFDTDGLAPLSSVVYPIPIFDSAQKDSQNEKLTRTEYAQPAIGTLSAALYSLLQQAGFTADFTAGHSFGELVSLWAAGVYDEAALFALAKARGKAMAPPADPNFDAGTMLAVKGDIHQLQVDLQAFPEITLANWNSNNQVVLAGCKPAIAAVQKALVEKGYSVTQLTVSAAFHTPLVGHAQKPFADAIQKVKFHKPAIKVYSNTTGQVHGADPEPIRQRLAEHILNPVRFKDEIEAIYAEGGMIFVEFGPKCVLTNLVKNILEGKPHYAIALNANAKKDSDRQLREAVAQLSVLGLDLHKFDPFALPARPVVERKKSAISFMLGAGLFLTEKTKANFANAVAQKNVLNYQNFGAEGTENIEGKNGKALQAAPQSQILAAVVPVENPAQSPPASPAAVGFAPAAGLGGMIDRLQALQSETLKAHSQFMTNDSEYTHLFGQLTQQELSLLANSPSQAAMEQINTALQTLDRSMAQFHQHQSETLRVHEQYLRGQSELINSLVQLSQAPGGQGVFIPAATAAAVLPAVKPVAAVQRITTEAVTTNNVKETTSNDKVTANIDKVNPNHEKVTTNNKVVTTNVEVKAAEVSSNTGSISLESITKGLLEIVSEKTGYPGEMLDLGMDMEADLGIDSIKRVEIMGAMQARFPELPKADAAALAEMRTLGQIVEYMAASAPGITTEVVTTNNEVVTTNDIDGKAVEVSSKTGSISLESITQGLLEIVSEKTGYPGEMLDLGMDMEADLGIDSIKRVEIMGAMQARFPELPKADAAALAEMRTLGQIVEYMAGSVTGKETTEVVTTNVTTDATSNATTNDNSNGNTNGFTDEAASSAGKEPGLPRGLVKLKALPEPDHLDAKLAEGHICLVMDDGTALTPAVAITLAGLGHKVVVLSLPEALVSSKMPLPDNIGRVQLDDLSEAGLQQSLAAVQLANGPVAVYIHLDPPASSRGAFSEAEKTIVKTAFLAAKYLKETLTSAAQNGYAAFMAVTRLDGKFGLADSGAVEPVSGGLFGLVKTLNLEWDKVFCRAIDLQPAIDTQSAARHIAAELYDPNRLICEVSYNPQGRFTLVVEQPLVEA